MKIAEAHSQVGMDPTANGRGFFMVTDSEGGLGARGVMGGWWLGGGCLIARTTLLSNKPIIVSFNNTNGSLLARLNGSNWNRTQRLILS